MGIIAKQQAKKWLVPVQAPIGGWLAETGAVHPELSRSTLLHLAALDALFRVDTIGAKSSDLGPGRYTTAQIDGSLRRSLMRVEQLSGTTRFSVGTVSGTGIWRSDWLLRSKHGEGQADLSIIDHRTREDQIPNAKLIGATWDAYGRTLAQGPKLRVALGPPDPSALLVDSVLPRETLNAASNSPFAHDYLLPPAPGFAHGARIYLPQGGLAAVHALADELHLPRVASDGGLPAIDLSGGRSVAARWLLTPAEGREALVFIDETFAGAAAMTRHRTFRAAMAMLYLLSRQSQKTGAGVDAAIDAAMVVFGDDQLDAERQSRFTTLLTNEIAGPALPVSLPGGVPVAVRIQTSSRAVERAFKVSQAWLAVRQRTWATGLTRKKQASSRVNGARRPYRLSQDGKILNYVRYGQFLSTDAGGDYHGDASTSWFWEAGLIRSAAAPPPDSGRRDLLVLLTGLGHGDGLVAYGTEVLALVRAFIGQIEAEDPHAVCSTYYVGGP